MKATLVSLIVFALIISVLQQLVQGSPLPNANQDKLEKNSAVDTIIPIASKTGRSELDTIIPIGAKNGRGEVDTIVPIVQT